MRGALSSDLSTLGADLETGLADCARREFITTHAAFGYLARRVGLQQIGISGLSPDAEPSPARVAEVQREAREHGITTVFYETLVSPAVAETIARDLGLATDVLDPDRGHHRELARDRITWRSCGPTWLALRTANGCS